MTSAKIRVVLADEFPIVLTGLRTLLAAAADMEVVAETACPYEVVTLVERAAPDVLVVDARMSQAAELARGPHAPHMLVLSGSDEAALTVAWPSQQTGFLSKNAPVRLILEAVRRVAAGETGWFCPTAQEGEDIPCAALTPRELDVLRLVVDGKTNHEIAARLGIADKTVEKHVGMLFDKLGVASRVEVAVVAVQNGLV